LPEKVGYTMLSVVVPVKWCECIPEFMFLVTQTLLDMSGK